MLNERMSAVLDEPEVHFEVPPRRRALINRTYPSVQFHLLEATAVERKRWWESFGAGTVILALIVLAVIILTAVIPSVIKPPLEQHHYVAVYLTLPPLPVHRAAPLRKPVLSPPVRRTAVKAPPVLPKPVFKAQIPTRTAAVRPVPKPTFAQPKITAPKERFEAMTPAVPKWKPKVELGKFATPSPLSPTTSRPARTVQTGGFGSPSGLRMVARDRLPGNAPKLGVFGAPDGPGHGNGSGGAYGARGVVASAGFGDAASSGGPVSGSGSGGAVRAGGFGDASVRSSEPEAPRRQIASASTQAVVILSKPDPSYTPEARQRHIQGEVVLDVVFTASGAVRVVRVVKGLGYGLDQSAVQDALEIRFRPAERGGTPVDTPATLRILFELAS